MVVVFWGKQENVLLHKKYTIKIAFGGDEHVVTAYSQVVQKFF